MKLISKYHDYYDTVLGHGRDESVVYVRDRALERKRLSKDMLPWTASLGHGATAGPRALFVRDRASHSQQRWYVSQSQCDTNWRYDEAFVLVAGKAYPVWLAYGSADAVLGKQQWGVPVGEVDPQVLVEAMRRRQSENRLTKPAQVELVHGLRHDDPDRVRAYDAARARLLEHDFTELHLQMQAPVLLLASPDTLHGLSNAPLRESQTDEDLVSNSIVVKNPLLADLGFARALDPFSCFQAIGQFIGGVAPGRQMPMVEISDKAKVQKKGFDPKYGFRTRPSSG